jgi:hypothetical protein
MEKNHYPNAGDVLSQIDLMMQEQQQLQAQQMGGMSNEMPEMSGGAENYQIP